MKIIYFVGVFAVLGFYIPYAYAEQMDQELQLAKVMVKALLLIDIMDELCSENYTQEQEDICQEFYQEQQENIDLLKSYEFVFINYDQYRENWLDSVQCGSLIRHWEAMKTENSI